MLRDHRSHATGATQPRGHDGQVKQGEQEVLHPRDRVGALLHESSLARTMPTDRILTGRCDTTLVGRGRSSD